MHNRIAITLLVSLLALAGCKAAATTDAGLGSTGTASTTPGAMVGAWRGNDVMSLAMGTLALDGTANAVDAAQAAELLPLWKGYRALLASDATAPEELAALAAQIREAMTAEQTTAMQTPLDAESQSALAARYGIEMPTFGAGMADSGLTEEEIAARRAEMEARMAEGGATGGFVTRQDNRDGGRFEGGGAGGPPAGAVIIGGGGPNGFQPPEGFDIAGGDAGTARSGANTWVSALVDALITYLEGLQ